MPPKTAPQSKGKRASSFNGIAFKLKDPLVFIDFLTLPEKVAVMQSALGLINYISWKPKGLEYVVENKVVDQCKIAVLNNNHTEVLSVIFQLMSELAENENALEEMASDVDFNLVALKMFKDTPVVKLQDKSSQYLSKVTKDLPLCKKIVNMFDCNFLFQRLTSADPDVQHNTLWLLYNLLQNIDSAEKVVNLKDFYYVNILGHLASPYSNVQKIALVVTDWLTSRPNVEPLRDIFRQENGLEMIFIVLEKFGWYDIHDRALKILANVSKNLETAKLMEGNLMERLVQYIQNVELDTLIEKALLVIAGLTTLPLGRRILLWSGGVEMLLPMLSDGTVEMRLSVCEILAQLMEETECRPIIVQFDPIPPLVSIFTEPYADWDFIKGALCTAYTLISKESILAVSFLPCIDILIGWLEKANPDVPNSIKLTSMHCLHSLCLHNKTLADVVNPHFLECLMNACRLYGSDEEIQVASIEALSAFVTIQGSAGLFLYQNGVEMVINELARGKFDAQPKVVTALAGLITSAITSSKSLMINFIEHGCLTWLVKSKSLWIECPSLEVLLDLFFKLFPSAKFAYTNQLTCQDKIKNGFYSTKTLTRDLDGFPYIPAIEMMGAVPIRFFYSIVESHSKINDEECSSGMGGQEWEDVVDNFRNQSSCQLDTSLDQCISGLKEKQETLVLGDVPWEMRMFYDKWVHETIDNIMTIVFDKLPHSDMPGHYHTLELHLQELKVQLGTTVIPLSLLKVGSKYERALLFKTLADQVGLPCWLQRGKHATAWNQVSLPKMKPQERTEDEEVGGEAVEEEEEEYYPFKALPTHALCPTHIVDLVTHGGRLIPCNTHEADVYMGRPSKPTILTHKTRFQWQREYSEGFPSKPSCPF